MITRLKVSNFKSHRVTDLEFGKLTLLTGLNSSGKSSVIQSLLLLRQSFKKGRLQKGLDLNVPLCDIGRGFDALYRHASDDIISFRIETSLGDCFDYSFNAAGKYDDSFIPIVQKSEETEKEPTTLSIYTNDFQYLSASRVANEDNYPMDSYAVEEERQISINYGKGELVAHFLEYYGEHRDFEIKIDALLHPTTTSKKLLDQVIAWEREISPRITIRPYKSGDKITFEFGYKSGNDTAPLKELKTKNVGFGISYSLAIVVALLSSNPGSIVIVENPEAHLHPRGQSKLCELICLAAENDIQVLVETHSDHIFNGIRKSVASNDITAENVRIHFFETDEQNSTIPTQIKLSEKGRVLNHRLGLFDQFDNDLDELLGL